MLTPAPKEITSLVLEPTLVPIPEGSFLMGSDAGQDCERPVHRVWIDSFFLASTQVTNAEYSRFLRATGKQPPPFWRDKNFDDPQQPVAGASWHEANLYCDWLTLHSGTQAPLAHRSRMGVRRSRRPRAKTLSLGRRSTPIVAELRAALANRAGTSRSLCSKRLRPV